MVTALAGDVAEVPATLVALTVNVYAVPLVRPVSVAWVAPVVVAARPPGEAVTVYWVTAAPPLLLGAVQDTTAAVLPGVAATRVGAPGTVFGVTTALASEAGELPAALVVFTVNL